MGSGRRWRRAAAAAIVGLLMAAAGTGRVSAWGQRAHDAINRAAVRAITADGPAFLQAHEDWIVYLAIIPDTWRRPTEPFLKILEDPNHGWFKEQFAFMTEVPRSRYEFVVALYDEHRKLREKNPAAAALTNVRWTGTLPYAAVESYERMQMGMRRYRAAKAQQADTTFIEREIASYMGRLGHYVGDGAMPLHDSIHHDGWQGDNPTGYTTDPRVHGRFESAFVDLIQLKVEDFSARVGAPRTLDDPFDAILAHLDRAFSHVEDVYRLDKAGALTDADNREARALVYQQVAAAATLLRDLAHTAWVRSGEPVTMPQRPTATTGSGQQTGAPPTTPQGAPPAAGQSAGAPPAYANPVDPKHPEYNPATGSAPAPKRRTP